ncbi:MAG: DUF2029 domain-containing protein [Bacteroidales bacterium]|jgi:hypothetical protein|nr:DUF2029 domain-containing protein [Bacteroidales bacterium]
MKPLLRYTLYIALFAGIVYWATAITFLPFMPAVKSGGFEKFNSTFKLDTVSFGTGARTDGETFWIGNAYVCKGINPLPYLMGAEPLDGMIAPVYNTPYLPWSYVIGQVFIPGFLSFDFSLGWYLFLSLVLYVWMGVLVFKTVKRVSGDRLLAVLALVCCLAQYGISPSLKFLNMSFIVIPLIVIAVLTGGGEYKKKSKFLNIQKHDLLAGIMLGLAMVKPQMAALFFIPFLFQKRFIPVIVGALVVALGWGTMAVLSNQNPWQLFMDYQTASSERVDSWIPPFYTGILDGFRLMQVSSGTLFMPQVLLCVSCVLFFSYKLKNAPAYISFLAPAVFSTCWIYTMPTNIPVLAIMIVAILLSLHNSKAFLWLLLLLLLLLLPTPEMFRRSFPVIFPLLQRLVYLAGMIFIIYLYKQNKTE